MKTNLLSFLGAASLLLSSAAYARGLSDVIDAEHTATAGKGCAGAIVEIHEESAGKGVILILPPGRAMKAQAKKLERVVCTVAIPLKLDALDQLVVSDLLIAGNVDLPKKARLRMVAEVFTPAQKGQRLAKDISGAALGAVELSGQNLLALKAHDSQVLRLNSSLLLENKSKTPASADFEGIVLAVELK